MTTLRTSVACRVAVTDGVVSGGGHGGWYGAPGDRCSKCGREVVVTGTFMEVEL